MNFNLLNKKWTSYFNWSFLYPSYFFLFIMIMFMVLFSIGYWDNFFEKLKLLYLLPILLILFNSVGFIIFLAIIMVYFPIFVIVINTILVIYFIFFIFFIISSDKLFQLFGYNRLFANLINIFLSCFSLNLIVFIFLWIKIKKLYKENNIECYWSGKLK